MSPEIKKELKALNLLVQFTIKTVIVLFVAQQAIWAAWVVFG